MNYQDFNRRIRETGSEDFGQETGDMDKGQSIMPTEKYNMLSRIQRIKILEY